MKQSNRVGALAKWICCLALVFSTMMISASSTYADSEVEKYKLEIEAIKRAMAEKDAKFADIIRVLKKRRVGLPAIGASFENAVLALGRGAALEEKASSIDPSIGEGRNGLLDFEAHRRHDCDDDPEQSCAPRCNSRWSDGSCSSWGSDYCGPDAQCAAKCNSRWSDGSCSSWGADYCGPGAVCSPNCLSRWSDGSCSSWGEDVCF